LLNLLATGRAAAIADPRRLLLTPKVRDESLFIYADLSRTSKSQIDGTLLDIEGLSWQPTELSEAEQISAVRFTADMDDGEAEALSVALERNLPILSDDLAVSRIAPASVAVETTLELVHSWSSQRSSAEVGTVLRNMRARANYAPPRAHPLRNWYLSALSEE
jgi:predicted nucleic acid-binding protein